MLVELRNLFANLEVFLWRMRLYFELPTSRRCSGVSITKLEHMRCAGQGPTWIRVGRSVRYKPADIDAYLAANTVTYRNN